MLTLEEFHPSGSHFEAAVDISLSESPASADNRAEVVNDFERHAEEAGYRGLVAVEGEEVVGVAYGYRSEPGQFVHSRLRESLSHEVARRWLTDCFEVAELGVRPDARGRGVGTQLHDALLEDVDADTAVATVGRDAEMAQSFLRAHGWRVVGDLRVGGDELAALATDL